MDTPALLKPLRASPPASTKLRKSGPRSLRTRSTMAVPAHSARQSQFWPCSRLPLAERSGRISAPVQPSPGSCVTAARALGDAAHFIDVMRRVVANLLGKKIDQARLLLRPMAEPGQCLAVQGDAATDAVGGLLAILHTAFMRGAGDGDERKLCDGRRHGVWIRE